MSRAAPTSPRPTMLSSASSRDATASLPTRRTSASADSRRTVRAGALSAACRQRRATSRSFVRHAHTVRASGACSSSLHRGGAASPCRRLLAASASPASSGRCLKASRNTRNTDSDAANPSTTAAWVLVASSWLPRARASNSRATRLVRGSALCAARASVSGSGAPATGRQPVLGRMTSRKRSGSVGRSRGPSRSTSPCTMAAKQPDPSLMVPYTAKSCP